LRDTGEKAGDEIEREAKDLDEAMTAYEELMWDRVPRLNDASEGLMRRIEELENRLDEQAGTLIATMAAKAAEHDEALRASLAGLLAALEEERGVMTQHLADEVAKPLAEAADAARQALAELGSGAQERDKRLVEARTQFVQALMDLEGAARPIPGTIQQIHDAYQQIDGL
jgi:chromosome segregation ATPase